MKGGGAQGYLIDKKSADKFGIKSVMDIKKHAKEFDSMVTEKQTWLLALRLGM